MIIFKKSIFHILELNIFKIHNLKDLMGENTLERAQMEKLS